MFVRKSKWEDLNDRLENLEHNHKTLREEVGYDSGWVVVGSKVRREMSIREKINNLMEHLNLQEAPSELVKKKEKK